MPELYLINPRTSQPAYSGMSVMEDSADPIGGIVDLALVTVAALAPEGFSVEICDERVTPVNLDSGADYIGITGRQDQLPRMIELSAQFRARGKTVMIGGPFASLCPDQVEAHADILLKGELEGVARELFGDLKSGTWKRVYEGGKPCLSTSPIPRWDLYPNDRFLTGAVQTSRGCPFSCEFCDVIQYVGRNQRHKSPEQVIAELEVVERSGYRSVFLADDNLTAHRGRARELLRALADWNKGKGSKRMTFITQLSLDAVKTPDILDLLAEAGPFEVFIGLETPNEESLLETGKRQNLGGSMIPKIRAFQERGISLMGGMIVGFDADKTDIFERQLEFAMASRIPAFTFGLLVAPAATPLYARMKAAGRLVESRDKDIIHASLLETNLIPAGMSPEELRVGARWLANRLYHPDLFGERLMGFAQMLSTAPVDYVPEGFEAGKQRFLNKDLRVMYTIHRLARRGPREAGLLEKAINFSTHHPQTSWMLMLNLLRYAQIRYVYDLTGVWNPDWVESPPATPFP